MIYFISFLWLSFSVGAIIFCLCLQSLTQNSGIKTGGGESSSAVCERALFVHIVVTTKSCCMPGWQECFSGVVVEMGQGMAGSQLQMLHNKNDNSGKVGLKPSRIIFLLKHLLILLTVVAFR